MALAKPRKDKELEFTEAARIAEDNPTSLEDLPTKHITEGPAELPIGYYEDGKFYKGFEVGELDVDSLTSLEGEQSNTFRTFGRIVARGLKRIYDIETGDEPVDLKSKTSNLFFPDVFFLMTEIIIKTKGSSLVPTVYQCPQCRAFTKFENDFDENENNDGSFSLDASDDELTSLNKEDLRDVKFTPWPEGTPVMQFKFKKGVTLGDDTYQEYAVRIPTIGDFIRAGGSSQNSVQIEKKVLTKCIDKLNDVSGKDLMKLITFYGDKILKLNLTEYMEISNKLNSIGYNFHQHRTTCAACGYEYRTTFDLTNFFGSVLGVKS